MFGGSPFYRTHNPYLHSAYQQPQPQYNPFGYSPYYSPRSVDLDRARSLAAQRARRAQWLPDEDDDEDYYDARQLSPHERAYLNAHRNQELIERERRRREQEEAEARRRAAEEQKWQRELDRRQKEDEATRGRIEEERERRRQQQQQQKQERRSHSPVHTIPITTADGRVPSPISSQQQQAPHQPTPQYDEKHAEAASVLQRHFRIHQSIRAIKSFALEFDTLRREFTYPSTISFQESSSTDVINVAAVSPSSVVRSSSDDIDSNVKIPKLAFNSTNYILHAYIEALDKILVKLDGVESWGDADVRTRRRKVVKQIEEEQAFVDTFWRTSWLKHLEEQAEWVDGDLLVMPRS